MEGRGGRRKKASIDSHFQEVKALLPGVSRFRISQATDVDGGGGAGSIVLKVLKILCA